MKKARRQHQPEFKAKVALASLQGDDQLQALAERFDVHRNLVRQWQEHLLRSAQQLFEPAPRKRRAHRQVPQRSMTIADGPMTRRSMKSRQLVARR